MDNDILYRLKAIDPKSVDPMTLLDILEAYDEIERLRVQLKMSEQRFAALKEAYDKNRRSSVQLYGSKALEEKE